MTAYDPGDRRPPPRLTGRLLSAAARAAEHPLLARLIADRLLADAGITAARAHAVEEPPTPAPVWPPPREPGLPLRAADFLATPPPGPPTPMPFARARDYHERYRDGALSPEQVAERALEAIGALDRLQPAVRAFVSVDERDLRRQAEASAARFRAGRAIGVLDGVPIAVKDELDQTPHSTTGGTTFLGRERAAHDATAVARLRAAGALLIGKTNMHEIGIQPTGCNVHHGQVRNPYDRMRDSGGSSSGSAAAVAAGVCPIAIGADGGGSVRIPAALCGMVGLKATYGRISEQGALPLCWSVAHIGPIAASVEDAALAYAAIAGADPYEAGTRAQPAPSLAGWDAADLRDVRLGVYRPWFEHADPGIVRACNAAIERLVALGARVQEIEIAELELLRVAHNITILSEMAESMGSHPESPRAHGPGVRLALAVARRLTAADYVWAQRVRTRSMAHFAAVFEKVDLIVTPATAMTAPRLPHPMPAEGWLDVASTLAVMRFIVAGNLLGLPGLTVPVGYDPGGLPIGLQLIGRPWEEALLLRAGRLLEAQMQRRRPPTYVDLLDGSQSAPR
jgi:Asp-tRNA(Asn)/Glu-tRNA(Gln) amidotransferase A subunit family amidase